MIHLMKMMINMGMSKRRRKNMKKFSVPGKGGSGFVMVKKTKTPHDRSVEAAAAEAFKWIQKKEFDRDVTAIWKALENGGLEKTRRVYEQVKRALRDLQRDQAIDKSRKQRTVKRIQKQQFEEALDFEVSGYLSEE
jgi:hypothetical protein